MQIYYDFMISHSTGARTEHESYTSFHFWSTDIKHFKYQKASCMYVLWTKQTLLAAVLCSLYCWPAVLTTERSLGGALAPPKSLQISHLDRPDVTPVRRTKATSTTLLVGNSRDMSPSIHNYSTDIFLRPLPKDVSILLSCSSWRNPVVEHIKRSRVCCQMQKCHSRIT